MFSLKLSLFSFFVNLSSFKNKILKNNFPKNFSLKGLKIAIDCANGAAYKVGPLLLRSLGAVVYEIGTSPNGFNINEKCGSTYPFKIQSAVKKYKAHVGISFDGDATVLTIPAGQSIRMEVKVLGFTLAEGGGASVSALVELTKIPSTSLDPEILEVDRNSLLG